MLQTSINEVAPSVESVAPSPLASRLYSGTVTHARMGRVKNSFRYGIYFLYLDLDELDELDASLRRFSHNGRALMSLRDTDHGPRDGSPLRPWIDARLAEAGVSLDGGSVRLLTFPRVWGLGFYPVAFWYCFHTDGTLRAVLAEVQNTFGEHHNYLLHDEGAPMTDASRPRKPKVFRVSPFISMDAAYTFHFTVPGETLSVGILDTVEGSRLLRAAVQLESLPLTDTEIIRATRRFGPMSARAVSLILFNAVKLIAKGVRVLPDPGLPEEETT